MPSRTEAFVHPPLSPLAPNQPFYVNQLQTSANSNYNSLQVSLTQRNWHGFNNQVAYTWSHSIDTASDGQDYVPNASQPNDSTNPAGNKGNSNFDARNRFVLTSTYDVPAWQITWKIWIWVGAERSADPLERASVLAELQFRRRLRW